MNEEYKKDFIVAGQIAGAVRKYGKSLIVKGASYNEVITKIRAEIKITGGNTCFSSTNSTRLCSSSFFTHAQP
jgi:methionyl aminopeptidase